MVDPLRALIAKIADISRFAGACRSCNHDTGHWPGCPIPEIQDELEALAAASAPPLSPDSEPMNLRMFADERGHWYLRGFGYSGNGPTPEAAMRDLVMHHNTNEENWPVKASPASPPRANEGEGVWMPTVETKPCPRCGKPVPFYNGEVCEHEPCLPTPPAQTEDR